MSKFFCSRSPKKTKNYLPGKIILRSFFRISAEYIIVPQLLLLILRKCFDRTTAWRLIFFFVIFDYSSIQWFSRSTNSSSLKILQSQFNIVVMQKFRSEKISKRRHWEGNYVRLIFEFQRQNIPIGYFSHFWSFLQKAWKRVGHLSTKHFAVLLTNL